MGSVERIRGRSQLRLVHNAECVEEGVYDMETAISKPVLIAVPDGVSDTKVTEMRRAAQDFTVLDKVADLLATKSSSKPNAQQKIVELHRQAVTEIEDLYWVEPGFVPIVMNACYRRFGIPASERYHGEA